MKARWERWSPVILLVTGSLLLFGVGRQQHPELRAPLASALPTAIDGLQGQDVPVGDSEAEVAGFTDYALRVYLSSADDELAIAGGLSIYIGFYDSQTRGRTIHSPKNCLPGSGWEALTSTKADIPVESGAVTVNRYVLQNGDARALVLYWYQGRGRVAHDEYLVKWDLLRDAALERRTDEALVRIVVPIGESEQEAFEAARAVAGELIPQVEAVLPA